MRDDIDIDIGTRKENLVETAVEKMEAQLSLWNSRIDNLADKTLKAGVQARFDALVYIDELKALHAIARAKLDEFKAGSAAERVRLKAGMKRAWNELDAAFKNPNSSP
jgi:hypothetical protein